MTENQWKATLIKKYKASHPNGFIWSFEAKFKAGFPDLMIAQDRTCVFFELKKVSRLSRNYWDMFEPIQQVILQQLRDAKIASWGLVLCGDTVYKANPYVKVPLAIPLANFNLNWKNPDWSWII